ncbi:MAG TPA: anthranilate synthase component I family protein [Pirellulales bacterium]|jgi:para-aminobenzoate synthetase component 1|nr:anthranilate synthase component I family protein [Pirellulales bacterium]
MSQPPTGTTRPDVAGLPLVAALPPEIDAEQAFLRLADRPHCLFFDSARRDPVLGRYSFVTADPFDYLEIAAGAEGDNRGDALALLAERMRDFVSPSLAGLPPFQGGPAGLVSYDLGRELERLPMPAIDEFGVPALAMGLYDVVVAFDHGLSQSWIVSQGWPERDPGRRRRRAHDRLAQFRAWLDTPAAPRPAANAADRLASSQLAQQFATGRFAGLTSNFSREGYLEAVARAIEYVRAGDIFQVNLSQRLLYPAAGDSVSLYRRLRSRNPAPFAGYFDLGRFQIVSASPERFLRSIAGQVEARPIKGTRPRTALPEADLFSGDELQESAKDRAENVMIVDLLRNDLSRVCLPESVQVVDLCRLETYEFVQHLVSSIRGVLAPGRGPLDLLRAAFPGGSITGAPKIRAMEIIAELEPTARGAYCGSLAYLGSDGAFDSNILIRTITAGRGWWQAPVGGGIVAQSDPAGEYQETWHKAEGLLRALTD